MESKRQTKTQKPTLKNRPNWWLPEGRGVGTGEIDIRNTEVQTSGSKVKSRIERYSMEYMSIILTLYGDRW